MKTLILITMASILVGCGCMNEARIAKTPPPASLSKQALREFLTAGRTIAEVTNRLGAPSSVKEEDGRVVMTFGATHDLLAIKVGEGQERSMATVVFRNGVVESSKLGHVSIIRRTK